MKSRLALATCMVATSFIAAGAFAGGSGGTATVASDASIVTGTTFTVDVNLADMSPNAVGAQFSVAYDADEVEYVGIAAGSDFTVLIYSAHDAANDRVSFASGVLAPSAGFADANIAKITFRALVDLCADTDFASFTTGAFSNGVADNNGGSLSFTTATDLSLSSYSAFALAGVPADVDVPADAGTTAGALVSLTSPTATDSCGASATVSFVRSDGELSLSAPFPVGTTTVTWSSTDPAGQVASGETDVVVQNYQLLTVDVDLAGSIVGTGSTAIRLKLSDGAIVNPTVSFGAAGDGASIDAQVPVAASYGCAAAADASHTLAQSKSVSVVGTKYEAAASYSLVGGDSTADNKIDVFDFGAFVGDFGAGKNFDSRSNFNRDTFVNNADFGFIGIGFLQVGETCGSAYTGSAPRTRVTVRELRRAGLGDLAAGDVNGDGWLDTRDIAYYLEHGIAQPGLSAE